jgi:hypothetical protein
MKEIYKQLGPFDHFEHQTEDDEPGEARYLRQEFIDSSKQSRYRGQVNNEDKPDGFGFKLQ